MVIVVLYKLMFILKCNNKNYLLYITYYLLKGFE